MALLWSGAACRGSSDSEITLDSPDGRTITLDTPAQRIVSYSTTATNILLAIDADDRMAATSSAVTLEPLTADTTVLGESTDAATLVAQAMSLDPDLVILPGDAEEVLDRFLAEGVPVLCCDVRDIRTIDATLAFAELLGDATGEDSAADAWVADTREHLRSVEQQIRESRSEPPRVYYESRGYAPTRQTLGGDLFAFLGADNVAYGEADWAGFVTMPPSEVAAANPTVIIAVDDETIEAYKARFSYSDAALDGRVYVIEERIARSGIGLLVHPDLIASLLYPEVFSSSPET